jgi:hypothetical protein
MSPDRTWLTFVRPNTFIVGMRVVLFLPGPDPKRPQPANKNLGKSHGSKNAGHLGCARGAPRSLYTHCCLKAGIFRISLSGFKRKPIPGLSEHHRLSLDLSSPFAKTTLTGLLVSDEERAPAYSLGRS